MKIRNVEISRTSALHYYKLYFRGLLFLLCLALYVRARLKGREDLFFEPFNRYSIILICIWVLFAVEIWLRFFPDKNKIESMGCQKQFSSTYIAPRVEQDIPRREKRTLAVLIAWIALNGLIAGLYFAGIIDRSILVLIALCYSVCDMICILYFCPFQTWFLLNKCCATCRIYNWDYIMMCTPLLFIPHWFTWSLCFMSIALVLRWEWNFHRHKERFFEETNEALACANCTEKLCSHKRQLKRLHKKFKKELAYNREQVLGKAAITVEQVAGKAIEKATEVKEKASERAAQAAERADQYKSDENEDKE